VEIHAGRQVCMSARSPAAKEFNNRVTRIKRATKAVHATAYGYLALMVKKKLSDRG
jgi:hypothetical protein